MGQLLSRKDGAVIVWSNVPRLVGKVNQCDCATDAQGQQYSGGPFFVGREATHDEWVADVRDNGGEPNDTLHPYYYEVAD